mgnify:FL=1
MSKLIPWRKKANLEWNLWMDNDGKPGSATLTNILLLEIREELKQLNQVFRCHNFQEIPRTLRGLRRDLKKKNPA